MTNSKNTKKALLASVLSMVLCMAMLIGSTFAWFTDTASTAVNRIEAGNLKVGLQYATAWDETTGEPTAWADAKGKTLGWVAKDGRAQDKILWEPGCTYTLPEIRIVNDGNLALKYKIVISGVTGDAKLLNAIDFTMKVGNKAETKLEGWNGVLLPEGKTAEGLDTKETSAITIKGHMKEEAGNEYMGLSLEGIGITVYAAQYTYEKDSIDDQYDAKAEYIPIANVTAISAEKLKSIDASPFGSSDVDKIQLDTGYVFTPTATIDEANASTYKNWHADFVVSVDKAVEANSVLLAGQYGGYSATWQYFTNPATVNAGDEIRLLKDAMGGYTVNYPELVELIQVFQCGAKALDDAVKGTTMTVELRMYETTGASTSGVDSETGNYVVCGTYSYTFK